MKRLFFLVPFLIMLGCASHFVEERFDREFFFYKKAADVQTDVMEVEKAIAPSPQEGVNAPAEAPRPSEEAPKIPEKKSASWWG